MKSPTLSPPTTQRSQPSLDPSGEPTRPFETWETVSSPESNQATTPSCTVESSIPRPASPSNGAELDIWETAPNGKYEQQDPDQVDMNLRGRFRTGKDGEYSLYCLRPTTYAIPQDGPAGKLLRLLDRHPMRPAHIHCIVTAAGYKRLTTELF